jgi:hypothetical protein
MFLEKPNNTTSNVDLDAIVKTLQDGASLVPPWFLSHSQRWRRLLSTLMGHPLIRGGQRPRDFPSDPAARRAVSSAVGLHRSDLPCWNAKFRDRSPYVRFGDWLHAYALLVEGEAATGSAEPNLAREATLVLVWQLLRASGSLDDDGRCQQFLAALGLTIQEGRPLSNRASERRRSTFLADQSKAAVRAAYVAYVAAVYAAHPGAEAALRVSRPHNEMLDRRVWLVSVKTNGVQEYMEAAREFWLARGASAWAAQSLALARELLADEGEEMGRLLLLTDVDAVARFAVFREPNAEQIRDHLGQRLLEALGPERTRRFPALDAWLRSISAPDSESFGASCLPRMSVEISEPLTVRNLCTAVECLDEACLLAAREQRECERKRCYIDPPAPVEGEPCAFVNGDVAITAISKVPWLEPRIGDPALGWKGVVWALAGSTHDLRQVQGLCQSSGVPPLRGKRSHREWLAALRETGPVVYLKLDGDGVGRALASMPALRAFSASLEIQDQTHAGLAEGLRRTLSCWFAAHPDEALEALPINVGYLGGDDLVCEVPESMLTDFLQGFESVARPTAIASFSGALLTVQRDLDHARGVKIPEMAAALVPGLLTFVKRRMKALPDDDTWTSLTYYASRSGFRLTAAPDVETISPRLRVWSFHLDALDILPLE